MKTTFYTLLLTGMATLPMPASAQTLTTKTTIATNSAQNLSQAELNEIKAGALTNNGQPVPVETKIMMSTENLDGYTVRKVQQSLAERGYYKGPVSGSWDSETSASVQSFQRASGDSIDESGKLISSGTLSRLGVTMDKLTAGDANSKVSHHPDLTKETRSQSEGQHAADQTKILGQITIPAPHTAPYTTRSSPVMTRTDSSLESINTRDEAITARNSRPGLADDHQPNSTRQSGDVSVNNLGGGL